MSWITHLDFGTQLILALVATALLIPWLCIGMIFYAAWCGSALDWVINKVDKLRKP